MNRTILCSTGEVVHSYESYLKTDHWKKLKQRYYDSKYKYECHACKTGRPLNLHHKSYKRIGNERLTDMVWLCTACHGKIHEYNKTVKQSLWKSTRRASKKIRKQCD